MIIDPKEVSIARFHSILLGAVGPRPIAFASTIDEDGNPNLSPFSFFNAFSANPPTLVFSPARRVRDNTTKHTLDNVKVIPEVVINVVTYDMVEQMSLSSTEYAKGVNEFEVFVEGKRLRKNSIKSYNVSLGMDSPAADVDLPAEFTIAANSSILTLIGVPPAVNTRITVVRKIGKLWNEIEIPQQSTTPLSQTENEIARFLRAKEVSLPQ